MCMTSRFDSCNTGLFHLFLVITLLIPQVTKIVEADEAGKLVGGKTAGFRERVVDLVILKDQTRIYGSSSEPNDSGTISVLIRTSWLQAECPEFFREFVEPALNGPATLAGPLSEVTQELQVILEELKREQPNDLQRIGLLKETLIRLTPDVNKPPDQVCLKVAKSKLRRLQTQPSRQKQLGFLAIMNNIEGAETLSWQVITEKLGQIPPAKLRTIAASLKNPSGEQTSQVDSVINAIMAALDIQSGRSIRIVQNGSQFYPEDQKADLSSLLGSLLTNNLEQQLTDLLGPEFGPLHGVRNSGNLQDIATTKTELPAAAQQIASQRNVDTVITSEFQFDVNTGIVSVKKHVFRKDSSNRWPYIFSANATASASQLTQGQRDAVANDPQVKAIISSLGALAGAQQLQTALNMGAAIKVASDQAEHEFQERVSAITNGKFDQTGGASILEIAVQ